MDIVVAASLVFPSVIFSLLLVVVMVYWLFVVIGALDMHMFDLDADFSADVGADFSADVGADVDADVDVDVDADGHGSVFADILARLDLTEIPLTVSVSLFVLLGWLGCVCAVQLMGPSATTLAVGSGVAVAASVVSLLATSQLSVFLKPMFRTHYAPQNLSLVGKTCTITTLSVTDKHGQAEVEDGGAGLVIQVRSSNAAELVRGSEALIFDYDAESGIFSVKPMGTAAAH